MTNTETALLCYHCGLECPDESIHIDKKYFCCNGCKAVYEILDQNNLCKYYDIEQMKGNTPIMGGFAYLDNPEITNNLLDYKDDQIAKATFYIPTIHCSSCLYLLENLYRINGAIERSKVDFLQKTVNVTFSTKEITFRQLVELLSSIGYEPLISQNNNSIKKQQKTDRKLLTQLAVAGFCAGNIMLFSFPEYLGLDDPQYKTLFGYLNILLALPVMFYSASGYFSSVYNSLKKGYLNIDFPILLSILVAFSAGVYQVIFKNGAGYFDSLTGLVFLLLVGKWFQQKTYSFLSFERDYKSYFPLAATRLVFGKDESVTINDLIKGDKILVKNGELIPADAMLYKGFANIDYSFVTGETTPVIKQAGDIIYAGGRQTGGVIELEVLKSVSQSYLTQLWNNDTFKKEQESNIKTFSNNVGKYFTVSVLVLAFSVALYWYLQDSSKMLNAFISILIIACPCTLALSYPFALGNGLRLFGKDGFFLKNADVIEQMANCDTIVFDKTGTLTKSANISMQFVGNRKLSVFEEMLIAALVKNSTHPVSLKIFQFLPKNNIYNVVQFKEYPGQGIEGFHDGFHIKIGSSKFVDTSTLNLKNNKSDATAYLAINGICLGYFTTPNQYRDGVENTIKNLNQKYNTYLISGDNDAERLHLEKSFWIKRNLLFEFSPIQKLDFIKKLQAEGKKVMMIGDGLNDAGALKQADVGIAVTENTTSFTPMSDAILKADHLNELPKYLTYSKFGLKLIKYSYVFSVMYNCIGLSFAVRGALSPMVAAILMPLNSITLVGIASLGMIWKWEQLQNIKKSKNCP
jgi:P-type Cu+ transporter